MKQWLFIGIILTIVQCSAVKKLPSNDTGNENIPTENEVLSLGARDSTYLLIV